MSYWIAALVALNIGEFLALWALAGRLRNAARVDARLAHFAEALTLLTDTTESGLAQVADSLAQSGRKSSRRADTRAMSKRIGTATRNGRSVAAIAEDEGLSESETRLHVEMSGLSAVNQW